jgi:hypothetical protein
MKDEHRKAIQPLNGAGSSIDRKIPTDFNFGNATQVANILLEK